MAQLSAGGRAMWVVSEPDGACRQALFVDVADVGKGWRRSAHHLASDAQEENRLLI